MRACAFKIQPGTDPATLHLPFVGRARAAQICDLATTGTTAELEEHRYGNLRCHSVSIWHWHWHSYWHWLCLLVQVQNLRSTKCPEILMLLPDRHSGIVCRGLRCVIAACMLPQGSKHGVLLCRADAQVCSSVQKSGQRLPYENAVGSSTRRLFKKLPGAGARTAKLWWDLGFRWVMPAHILGRSRGRSSNLFADHGGIRTLEIPSTAPAHGAYWQHV